MTTLKRWLLIALVAVIAAGSLWGFVREIGWAVPFSERLGGDYNQYMGATRDWLAGQPFYHAWQVAEPYWLPTAPGQGGQAPNLYPPYALVLFVPFALLPSPISAVLWWTIPLSIIVWVLWKLRPPLWTYPVLAACLLWKQTIWLLLVGNPAALWGTAALSLGTLYGWPALGVMLRPMLAPFALLGIRQRSWWIALGASLLLCALFLPMWPDYIAASLNARGATMLYLWEHVPLALVPVVPWLARLRNLDDPLNVDGVARRPGDRRVLV